MPAWLDAQAWQAIGLTLKLASLTTLLLLALATPLAWWLAQKRSTLRTAIESLVAMPLVLPPTVLGFYLLIAFAPQSAFGVFWQQLTGQALAFSFEALVIGSILYSLPFVVQPLQAAFQQIPCGLLEAASTLGAAPIDRWFSVVLPLCRRSFFAAASLGFAHTVGEFGVVLMIGGNIPGETKVAAIAVYDEVESMNYAAANSYSLVLFILTFLILLLVYLFNDGHFKRFWL